MRQLIDENKLDEASKCFSEFKDELDNKDFMFLSGNETVDIVLNQKIPVAKESGIHIMCDFQKVTIDSIKDYDLCAMLSNVLDNAIEAASKCEDKVIQMSLKKENDCLIVKEENAYSDINVLEDGTLVTTKKDKQLHGLGIKNIKRIVEGYNGYMRYELNDGRFLMKIVIED